MSEHLPECDLSRDCGLFHGQDYCHNCEQSCICAALRACEQRVFQEQIEGRQHDMVLGYQRGLAAARHAVVKLPKGGMGLKAHELWRMAVTAIDDLREGKAND